MESGIIIEGKVRKESKNMHYLIYNNDSGLVIKKFDDLDKITAARLKLTELEISYVAVKGDITISDKVQYSPFFNK